MGHNPLISEPGMADPHVLIHDDYCYLFTGHDIGFDSDDWVMPDWRIYKSSDLRHWELASVISPRDTYMPDNSDKCWAGDIVCRDRKFFWYYSNHNKDIGVMVASAPEGPYRDVLGGPLVNSYDPTILIDDDEHKTPYIAFGSGTYQIARLKDSMLELDETPQKIVILGYDQHIPDKNSLHKHNGLYYLSWSSHYATSDNVYGPYTYRGRVGTEYGLDTNFAHGDFFEWGGQWYHVWCKYLDRSKNKVRDSYMAYVSYNEQGDMYHDRDFVQNHFAEGVVYPRHKR